MEGPSLPPLARKKGDEGNCLVSVLMVFVVEESSSMECFQDIPSLVLLMINEPRMYGFMGSDPCPRKVIYAM